jgi:hypothetical protein
MKETEVRGELTAKNFLELVSQLKNSPEYEYEFNKRITFCYGDYSNQNLDMRVRITNGKPVIMQKVGNWQDLTREEIEVDLVSDSDHVFKTYRIISNIYLTVPTSFETIIQHENHLFTTSKFELKLTRQFGKSDYYIFELEAKTEDVDLESECNKLGLNILNEFESEDDRKKRNENVNLNPKDLSEDELKDLISDYLS